jgi:hypothetical protein
MVRDSPAPKFIFVMRIIGSLVGLLVALSILCACSSGDDSGKVLDIRNVVNKTPEQVAELLGEPDTTYTERILGKEIFCQRYYRNNIEIQYPESLSTDVVVYGPHGLPFTQSAL